MLRRSSSIMAIALAAGAVIILGLTGISRLVLERYMSVAGETAGLTAEDRELTSRSFEAGRFEKVFLIGSWNVEITEGEPSVTLEYPRYLEPHISVKTEKGVLTVEAERSFTGETNLAKAVISVPALSGLKSFGGVTGSVKGVFDGDFDLVLQGGSSLHLEGGPLERMNIEADGGIMVDASRLPAEHVDVEINGAGSVELNMAGGDLTGSVNGAAAISYSGSIRDEKIRTSGVSSVKQVSGR